MSEIEAQNGNAITQPDSLLDGDLRNTPTPELTPIPQTASTNTSAPSDPREQTFNYPKDQPIETIMGGAPIRQWINRHLTKAVLDGMRYVAKERPEDPVRVLGEYLIKLSEESKQKEQLRPNTEAEEIEIENPPSETAEIEAPQPENKQADLPASTEDIVAPEETEISQNEALKPFIEPTEATTATTSNSTESEATTNEQSEKTGTDSIEQPGQVASETIDVPKTSESTATEEPVTENKDVEMKDQ